MIPVGPLQAVGRKGALVTVQVKGQSVRRWPQFPPRPEPLSLSDGREEIPYTMGCQLPPDAALTGFAFRDRGRDFLAVIALGPEATDTTRETALAVLNNFEVKGLHKAVRP